MCAFFVPVSKAVRQLKIGKIAELVKNSYPALCEGGITAADVATERMRLPCGLLGSYNDKMFEGDLLKCQSWSSSDIIDKMFIKSRAHDKSRVPAEAPLSVRSLVDSVNDLLDKGIIKDPSLNKMCQEDPFVSRETNKSFDETCLGGVFLNPHTESTALKDRFK